MKKELLHEKWIDMLSDYQSIKFNLIQLTYKRNYIDDDRNIDSFIEKIFLKDFYYLIESIKISGNDIVINWHEKPDPYAFTIINEYRFDSGFYGIKNVFEGLVIPI